MFLREVADLHSVSGFHGAGVRGFGTGQQPQQRGLSGAVQTEHDDARTAVDGQVDAGEHLQRTVVLGQALGDQRDAAAGRGRRELDPGDLVGHPFVVERCHHPVGPAQHILRGNGFGGLGPHLGGLGTQRGGLAFGVGTFAAAPLFVGGAGVEVLLPAHVVDVDLTAHRVEEPDAVDHVGEQLDVVADHHQPTGVTAQELAQPAQRVGVEVVGGFVE